MTENLFAACRHNGRLVSRRVRLDRAIQSDIEELFGKQEDSFRPDNLAEIDFNGSWKPESHELLTIDIPEEAKIFEEIISANATSIQDIDISRFSEEGIKALFTGSVVDGKGKILVQKFTPKQMLKEKFALLYSNNVFRRLTEPAFALDSDLTCIIEDGKIKFKSLHKLRSIINMKDIYREATEPEVRAFCAHKKLLVADVNSFLDQADQPTRKLITAINHNKNLNNYDVAKIQASADKVAVQVTITAGKIVMPKDRADIKNLLRFLDDSLYTAELTGQRYITNSKRTA